MFGGRTWDRLAGASGPFGWWAPEEVGCIMTNDCPQRIYLRPKKSTGAIWLDIYIGRNHKPCQKRTKIETCHNFFWMAIKNSRNLCNEIQAINSVGDLPSIQFMASFQLFLGFGAEKIGGRLYPPTNQDMPGILVVCLYV